MLYWFISFIVAVVVMRIALSIDANNNSYLMKKVNFLSLVIFIVMMLIYKVNVLFSLVCLMLAILEHKNNKMLTPEKIIKKIFLIKK